MFDGFRVEEGSSLPKLLGREEKEGASLGALEVSIKPSIVQPTAGPCHHGPTVLLGVALYPFEHAVFKSIFVKEIGSGPVLYALLFVLTNISEKKIESMIYK